VAVRTDLAFADGPRPWSQAWAHAAFGAGGFYADPAHPGPGAHFRTSAHVGTVLARALARLLAEVDDRLGSPAALDLVDVGAGRGELVAAVLGAAPDELSARVRATAIDLRPRPDGLDPRVRWVNGTAPHALPTQVQGLLVAHEWLDDVPLDVVEVDPDGTPCLVLVDADGTESAGPAIDDDTAWAALGLDAAAARIWLARWWPVAEPGDRAEVGRTRDLHWQVAVRRLVAGTALAVDYGHTAADRPRRGTLTAYADGRRLRPVPDGTANLTAHVALDALLESCTRLGRTTLRTQRDSLIELGVDSSLPDAASASAEPVAYAEALRDAADASELLDPACLGGFAWLRVDVG
jgi:SAM-dependent MidA family methyltransferase